MTLLCCEAGLEAVAALPCVLLSAAGGPAEGGPPLHAGLCGAELEVVILPTNLVSSWGAELQVMWVFCLGLEGVFCLLAVSLPRPGTQGNGPREAP